MSILIDKDTNLLVLAITGRAGVLQTKTMIEYGTKVVAGVTPGKGGLTVEGIPVYDFVAEAIRDYQIDSAISFVPPHFAKDSCFEVIDSGIKFLIITAEEIPDHDAVDIIYYAKLKGTRILGPGSAGLIAPGKSKLGAHPSRMFLEGHVGIVSKSGALSYEVGKILTDAGIGQSTVVAIGGGPIWGLTQKEVIKLYQEDEETKEIILLGEIGGSMEEEAAEFISRNVDKPIVSLIVGRSAPKGKLLGHASAIIEGNKGTVQSKVKALSKAGSYIARTPTEIVQIIEQIRGK